jgi:hypothetical protein
MSISPLLFLEYPAAGTAREAPECRTGGRSLDRAVHELAGWQDKCGW